MSAQQKIAPSVITPLIQCQYYRAQCTVVVTVPSYFIVHNNIVLSSHPSTKLLPPQVTNARQYAITKFARSVAEVADNLQRATESVKEEDLAKNEQLKLLYEGVKMTDSTLLKIFKEYGITKYDPMGEKFDPNFHEAMFQVESEEVSAG